MRCARCRSGSITGPGYFVCPESAVVEALVGRRSEGAREDAPATWVCPELRWYLSVGDVRALLAALRARRHDQGKNVRRVTEAISGIDLDAVLWAVIEALGAAVARQEAQLATMFARFDTDEGGLDHAEFTRLVEWCVGAGRMSERAAAEVFEHVEDAENDDDDEIDDAHAFAASLVRWRRRSRSRALPRLLERRGVVGGSLKIQAPCTGAEIRPSAAKGRWPSGRSGHRLQRRCLTWRLSRSRRSSLAVDSSEPGH